MNALSDASDGAHVDALFPDICALATALRAFLDALLNMVDVLAALTLVSGPSSRDRAAAACPAV